MIKVGKRTYIITVALFICGLAYGSAQFAETEPPAKTLLADISAKDYVAVVQQFHYATTVTAQARSDDRAMMVGELQIVFNNLDGVADAQRVPKYDVDGARGLLRVLGIFAGDASDWQAESARLKRRRVSYMLQGASSDSLVLTFTYVQLETRWELLDISLGALVSDTTATARVAQLQSKLVDYILTQSSKH